MGNMAHWGAGGKFICWVNGKGALGGLADGLVDMAWDGLG
jgi:hypothetical protein